MLRISTLFIIFSLLIGCRNSEIQRSSRASSQTVGINRIVLDCENSSTTFLRRNDFLDNCEVRYRCSRLKDILIIDLNKDAASPVFLNNLTNLFYWSMNTEKEQLFAALCIYEGINPYSEFHRLTLPLDFEYKKGPLDLYYKDEKEEWIHVLTLNSL